MITTLTVIHVIVSVLLILTVLLHFGKGAEVGLMMEASSSILPQKGNILNKITSIFAILFLTISLSLAVLRSHKGQQSVFDSDVAVAPPLSTSAPVSSSETPENENMKADQKQEATQENQTDEAKSEVKEDAQTNNQ